MRVPGGGCVPAIQGIPLPETEMLEEEPLYVNAKQPIIFVRGGKPRVNREEEGTFQRKEGSTCMRHAIAQKRGENGQDDYSLQRKRIVPHMQETHQINFLKKQWYRSSKCSHTGPCDADDQGCIPCHCFHLF